MLDMLQVGARVVGTTPDGERLEGVVTGDRRGEQARVLSNRGPAVSVLFDGRTSPVPWALAQLAVPVDAAGALEALQAGRTVRMVVGTGTEDPILRVWIEDGCAMSAAVAGWSAGCVEPVCGADSPFLATFLEGRHALEVIA